jgi:ankyrin repeat protein
VGFVCGRWAAVQYERWQKRKPNIRGWIETSRLTELSRGPVDKLAAAYLYGKHDPLKLYDRNDPLVQAAAADDLIRLRSLIEEGEDPNGLAKSGEPLAAAIAADHIQVVKLLLKAGAASRTQTPDGHCRNLFDIPPALDDVQLFKALVRANADLNCHAGAWQTTTLMTVSGLSRVEAWHWADDYRQPPRRLDPVPLVKRLLNAGADVNATDLAGRTALFYTLEDNNIDVAKILLDAGANPNIHLEGRGSAEGDSMAAQQGATPLMEALWWYSLTNDPTMTRLLLAYHENPNYRDTQPYDTECDQTTQGKCTFQGQTVLTRAAEEGYHSLVRILLEHGADASIPREDGALAVDIANNARTAALIASWVEMHRQKALPPR